MNYLDQTAENEARAAQSAETQTAETQTAGGETAASEEERTEGEPAEAKPFSKKEFFGALESMLYVSGEPIGLPELVRVFDMPEQQIRNLIAELENEMREGGRGILPYMTETTVQLVTNPRYNDMIVSLLSPPETRSMSDSVMETLSVIAYRQPVTRADIEAVRGVRCEYSVSQLLKQGLIRELGRKDAVGKPMLFGTTDAFLRKFGLHSLDELPPIPQSDQDEGEPIDVV